MLCCVRACLCEHVYIYIYKYIQLMYFMFSVRHSSRKYRAGGTWMLGGRSRHNNMNICKYLKV